MSNWINADLRLPHHYVILQLTRRSQLGQTFTETLRTINSPAAIEAWLRDMLKILRPGLEGCIIGHITYCQREGCWEFGIEHPSLPAVADDGAEYRRERLEPAEPT